MAAVADAPTVRNEVHVLAVAGADGIADDGAFEEPDEDEAEAAALAVMAGKADASATTRRDGRLPF